MVPSKSAHCDNPSLSNTIDTVVPSGSESDFEEPEDMIIVTESDPSRAAAKRKAPNTPSSLPPGKRTQVSRPTHDVPGKTSSQNPPHDPRFWYPDGNVVIKVGNTYFKLLRSRLAQQCRFFQLLFSLFAQIQPQPSSSTGTSRPGSGGGSLLQELDGCAVYEVPGIDVSDFTTFISYLEYPLEHSVFTAPCDQLYALLRAADILSCDLVHRLAKKAVAKKWPSLQPPARDTKTRRNAVADGQLVSDAIQAIVHARKYRIPNVVKRAFYELLRSKAFWDAVDHTHTNSRVALPERESSADRDLLAPLSCEDLVHLQTARWKLREAWDKLVRTPPGSDAGGKGTTCAICPPAQNGQPQPRREDAWAVEIGRAGYCVEFGDPIAGTYLMEDWLGALKRHSQGKWCEGCLEEREGMWKEARTTWWQQLDGWLQTGLEVSAVAHRVPLLPDSLPRKPLSV